MNEPDGNHPATVIAHDMKLQESEASNSSYQRHDSFYLEDVYFMFDNTIFKFPKQYLGDSPIFQKLFKNDPCDTVIQEAKFSGSGTSPRPYTCSGVKKETFAFLLQLSRPTTDDCKATEQEWMGVLDLASRWRMDRVLNTAVRHLSGAQLDPVTKLELAKKHNIRDKEWLFSAICALAKDGVQLTESQAHLVGCDVALKIARIQGMVYPQRRRLFDDDDDWKLIMDKLEKEGILKDKWQSAVNIFFQ
ncbi:hypothetical protein F5887DRAFT_1076745 [Amanita rubescens]|nr:hypothetical protein F5887DRAFT_1076745 [Amanita rubescens]